ncbi:MAG: hypothetical protein DMG57_07000 [Acidobacteria bacterium]|nr:MAG: hypothetical protein DMG57_07000 [Acidobacteriota bacterium]
MHFRPARRSITFEEFAGFYEKRHFCPNRDCHSISDRNGTYGRAREVEALPDFGLARALLGRFFRHRFGLFSVPAMRAALSISSERF